jgi:small subunit ribosomal protein S36
MGSVANNDSLMILLFWLLTLVILRVADGDLRIRVAALAGLVTGLALYTKGFALVLPLWMLAALLVALHRAGRAHLRQVATAGLVYVATAIALGGWWWIANMIRYGELAPSRQRQLVPPPGTDVRDYGNFLEGWATATTRRFWGDFGWFDTHIPAIAVYVATAVAVVALLAACLPRDRVAGSPWGNRVLLAAPIGLLVGLQFALALRAYRILGRMPGLQGRYWFGSLASFAVLVALGIGSFYRRWLRWLPLTVLGCAVAMNALAVKTILDYYWGAPSSTLAERVRAVVAWAPLEGEVLGVGAAIGAVIAAMTLVQLARRAIRSTDRPTIPTPPDGQGSGYEAVRTPTGSLTPRATAHHVAQALSH